MSSDPDEPPPGPGRMVVVRNTAVWYLAMAVAELGPDAAKQVHGWLKREMLTCEPGTVPCDAAALAMDKLFWVSEVR